MSLARLAVALVAAAFVGLLGVLIKHYGMVSLIAGYDPDAVDDEEGLADFVGANALYVAAALVLVGAFDYAEPIDAGGLHWALFAVAVVALAARMVVGSRRYERSDRARS